MNSTGAIEMLKCALINCDNIKIGGLMFVEVVKEQIKVAIRELDAESADVCVENKRLREALRCVGTYMKAAMDSRSNWGGDDIDRICAAYEIVTAAMSHPGEE
jgi:hypothetical protein